MSAKTLLGGAATAALNMALLVPAMARAEVVDCVAVQVNNEIITFSDAKDRRKAILEDLYRMKLPEDQLQGQLDRAKTELIPALVEERLLLQKATDVGVEVSPQDIDRIIQSIMEQNKLTTEEALNATLEAEGMSLRALRGNIERRSIIEKLKQMEIAAKVVVTDEEAKRYYDAHQAEFAEPERVRLREIVLLTEGRNESEVREEIDELANLVRNGADFAELATLFSHAPSAEHGGDLGLSSISELSSDIVTAVAKLQTGQVTDPIKTRFGYHILKLVERKTTSFKAFDEARGEIASKIQQQQFDQRVDTYVAALRAQAFVRINESCVANLN